MSLDSTPQEMPDEVDPSYGGLLGEPPAAPYIPQELQLPQDDPAKPTPAELGPFPVNNDDIKWRRQRSLELAIELGKITTPTPTSDNLITIAGEFSAFVEGD